MTTGNDVEPAEIVLAVPTACALTGSTKTPRHNAVRTRGTNFLNIYIDIISNQKERCRE